MLHTLRGNHKTIILVLTLGFATFLAGSVPVWAAASEDIKATESKREAEKEGKVTFYTSFTLQDSMAFVDRFQKKYPLIKVELNRSNNTQLLNRLLAEQRAKKNTLDVVISKADVIYFLQKSGLLARYLSPERQFFTDGFKDKEGYWTDVYLTVHTVAYNTRMVAPQEVPTTYQDLLKPQWKGKIGFNPNNYMWPEGVMQIMGKEAGIKYMEALARQNPIVRDGGSLNVILTAAGEVALALPINANLVEKEKIKGAPVDWARLKPYYADAYQVAMANHAPHPNAAKLLLDYFISQEGQELMVALGNVPARKGLKSRIARPEEITTFSPALGDKIDYYNKLLKQIFANK